MINKNKEEIEKILEEIKEAKSQFLKFYSKGKLLERIKTSIEWCEWILSYLDENEEPEIYSKIQSHLKWLKEKRGQDD